MADVRTLHSGDAPIDRYYAGDTTALDSLTRAGLASRLTTALADRYCVERQLGAGGMATVYLAEDLKHPWPPTS